MKKSVFLILVTLAISSCVDQLSSDVRFTIYNQTDKQVTVSGFSANAVAGRWVRGIADPIIIALQASFTAVRINGVNDTTHMRFYSLHDGGIDSVRVVFGDNTSLGKKIVSSVSPTVFSVVEIHKKSHKE